MLPATSGAGTRKPVHKTVKVADDFLSPTKITVPRRSTISWKWQAANQDSHNVALVKHPKGVKRFESSIATTNFTYKRKLTVKGKYVVICKLHPYLMRQTIIVR